MAMGAVQAVNIQTGAREGAKYVQIGTPVEIWTAAVTTALASGDTISGPILPANNYLVDLTVDCGAIGTGATYTVGYTGQPAAFLSAGAVNTVGHANVSGALGFTATTPTTILLTMTGTAGTPAAGTIRIAIEYTASP